MRKLYEGLFELLNTIVKDPAITAILLPAFMFFVCAALITLVRFRRKLIWSKQPNLSKEEKQYHVSLDLFRLCLPGLVAFACFIQVFYQFGRALKDVIAAFNF